MSQESEIKGEGEMGGRSADPYPGVEIHDEEERGKRQRGGEMVEGEG